jgi:NADPH-dependent curcumin reductase CurA
MQQSNTLNRRIVLATRPRGLPTPQDFRLEEIPIPKPGEAQVLLRTLYLSLDPYMRNLMDEVGPTYAPSVRLGQPMVGGTVNRVVTSEHPKFRVGDLVLGNAGWQDYALSDGHDLLPLGEMAQPSLPKRLAAACPDGIDIYFENVGGVVLVRSYLCSTSARVCRYAAISHITTSRTHRLARIDFPCCYPRCYRSVFACKGSSFSITMQTGSTCFNAKWGIGVVPAG